MSHNSAMNAVDPDSGNGEVTIRLPPDCFQIIGGKNENIQCSPFIMLCFGSIAGVENILLILHTHICL